jgi:hypothetical protein
MKKPTMTKAKPLLEKVRGIKDCATGNWTYEFEFLTADGARGRATVPGDQAKKATALINQLNLKGASLPDAKADLVKLINGIITAKPTKLCHQVANAGWQVQKGGSIWYTVGNRLVGAPTGNIEYAAPQMISESAIAEFTERGTLDDWKNRVALIALYSTSLTIGISAALAAPLMRAAGLSNFGIHLSAETRGGKSTTMLVGMSVSGIGDETKLMNWNTSGTAELLESAAAFNDALFSLNEVGAAKGKKKDAYPVLREFYMQYADGRDRRRHSSWEKAHGGRAKEFRGICIVSAEHSVAWYAEQAEDARDGGELFRAIDLPAVRGGHDTVLDLAPEDLNQNDCLDKLRVDLKVVHGAPLRPYIEHLIALGPIPLNKRVRILVKTFVKAMPAAAHDKVARQIAKHIGVLYAGAILGIEAGILPWTPEHVRRTHRTAFNDAFEACKIADPLEMALKILKTNVRDKIVERTPDSTFGSKDHAGYWEVEGGEKIIVVHARQFRSWFAGGGRFRLVLEWLGKQGHLKHAKGATNGTLIGEDFDGVTLRWPRSKMVRSFSFSDPFAEPAEKAPEQPPVDPKGRGAGKTVKPRLGGPLARRGPVKPEAEPKLSKPGLGVGKRPPHKGNKKAARPQLLSILEHPVVRGKNSGD